MSPEEQAKVIELIEAVIAAVYLDSGIGAARNVLRRSLFKQAIEERGERIAESDRKSALQEYLQARGKLPAEYRLAAESGPDHQKIFAIEVWINGQCLAKGQGSTKKEAEQRAASSALAQLELKDTGND